MSVAKKMLRVFICYCITTRYYLPSTNNITFLIDSFQFLVWSRERYTRHKSQKEENPNRTVFALNLHSKLLKK